ncbi:MAG TPA: hypothetical protein VK105_22115 [Virgibacillus sp.]|nr:hypothetical protein [Virgibacillus sp.]HLR69794.1 hypothetical protein [Virgibacillus sp.]
MKSSVKEEFKLYLRMVYGYIKDFLPSLLLIYVYIPINSLQFGMTTYIVTSLLLIFVSILLFISKTNKKRWLYSLITLIALLFSQNAAIVFLFLMIFFYLIFLFKVRKEVNLFIYLIDLLIFMLLLVIITAILMNIPYAIKIEETIVAVLLVTVALYLASYTIKISLDVLKHFSSFLSEDNHEVQIVPNKRINTFLKRNFLVITMIGIMFLLLLPDFIYAWFMYDLYFSLFPKHEFNFLTRLFYAISNHFNIILDKENIVTMDNVLISTKSGNFIKIVHIVLLKLIDTIILGAIIGMFVEYLKSFVNKEKTEE